jgi:predicted TIM-barrel fold metal-dependent hydrolase
LVVSIEHLIEDPNVLYANFGAFNRWLDEEWGYSYRDRLFAPPYISLRDLDRAVDEVERVLERGARLVMMSAAPAYGRSPGDPYFDPVWSRLNDAGATVAYHVGDSGYNKSVSVLRGQNSQPESYHQSAWQWMNTFCDRPIMDTLSALIYDNVFGRFPRLKAVAVEFGCEWMPYFLRRLDKMRGMGRNGPWIGGKLDARPSEIFRRHVLVTPFPEDDVLKVTDEVGGDSLVLGSDYPHAEGLAEPMSFAESSSRSTRPRSV